MTDKKDKLLEEMVFQHNKQIADLKQQLKDQPKAIFEDIEKVGCEITMRDWINEKVLCGTMEIKQKDYHELKKKWVIE